MAKKDDIVIYNDDVYEEIVNEFDQIRTARTMYISKSQTEGALHLTHEGVNNGMDEGANPGSPADTMDITLDERSQKFSVSDNGRGIPFEKMVDVCSKKHTSTKFRREGEKMKEQSGRNGVGLVVTVALSDYFSMMSYRRNPKTKKIEEKLIEFIDGNLIDHEVEPSKEKHTGLCITFKPSEKYLDGEVNMTCDMIEDYLRHLSYIMRDGMTINFYGKDKDYDEDNKKSSKMIYTKYTPVGLKENVKYLSSSIEFPPVEVNVVTDDFDIDLAFSYDKTLDDFLVESYCNNIITTEGGYHEQVALSALCSFFSREAKKLDPNHKYEVTYEDCKKGLIYCVNCRHVDPAFEGQHKSKASNPDVKKMGHSLIAQELTNYFSTNNGLLRKIISYLRQIAKIRMESYKIKGVSAKKQVTSFMDDYEIPAYYPIANRHYKGPTEIFIAEGDSAGDAINAVRNPVHQAVLSTRGVIVNVMGMSLAQVKKIPFFYNLAYRVLGCGMGDDFDITKLRFVRIIILTDADIDGVYIFSLTLCFIYKFMPELIERGKVYRGLPPLLLLDKRSAKKWYNGDLWLYDKNERTDIIDDLIVKNTRIAIPDGPETKKNPNPEVIPLSKKEHKRWMKMNKDYYDQLNRAEERANSNNKIILETICWFKLLCACDKNELRFKELIESAFPEMTYDIGEKSLYGSYNGEHITVIIDKIFLNMTKRFMKCQAANQSMYVYVKNANDTHDLYEKMTIGQYMALNKSKYNIGIEQRYKGLGEAMGNILALTTLNPKTRKLLRLTIDDKEKIEEMFSTLHGKTNKMREKRREILEKTEISYDDLDN